jgi:hypothetical protein
LRAVWFAVSISVSLLMPENFDGFYSDVTNKCLTNGTFYYSLCGPRGAERLPFQRWSALYTGYRDFDLDVVQAYAGLAQQRAETIGRAAAGENGALLEQAANAWFEREPTLPETDQAARFYHEMCRLWRSSPAGEAELDEPQRFADFATGSIAHIASSWAYTTCKRSKQRVFVSRIPLEPARARSTSTMAVVTTRARPLYLCAGRLLALDPQPRARGQHVSGRPRRVQEGGGAVPRLGVRRPHCAHELYAFLCTRPFAIQHARDS